jgi:hypothetical protein
LQDTPKFPQIGIFGLKIHTSSGNPGRAGENLEKKSGKG